MLWREAVTYWRSGIIAAGIFYLSLIKAPAIRLDSVAFLDKWEHMLAYAVLGGVLLWDMHSAGHKARASVSVATILPMVYGGLLEIVQYYCPPRSGEWLDWLADIVGVMIGVVISSVVWKIRCSIR